MRVDLYGYDNGFRDDDSPTLHALGEVTFSVRGASELRHVAAFLLFAAERLEALDHFDHEHLRDWSDQWAEGDVDLVVAKAD